MLSSDVWSLIIQHVDCTKSLLKLRMTGKSIHKQIPMELIIGAPPELSRLLLKPKTTKYEQIQVTTHEDMEGAISEDGTRLWSWVYNNPIRLTQYNTTAGHNVDPVSMHIISISTTSPSPSFLWIAVTDNDMICLLTAETNSASPLGLTVLRRCQGDELLEIALVKKIERRHVMRNSVFLDEEEDSLFMRGSLQCCTWNDRTFIIMLSIHFKENISLLEIGGKSTEWKTWYIPCGSSKRIGCIKQVKNLIYIIPANAGRVYVIDIHQKDPSPFLIHLLPEVPNSTCRFGEHSEIQKVPIVTMMEVSENGVNYILSVTGIKQVLHLTETTSRQLDKKYQLNVDAISFIGNDAAICFTNHQKCYRLYNLKTKDFVRTFRFGYTPFFALMKNNCIWSINNEMEVYRQIADDE